MGDPNYKRTRGYGNWMKRRAWLPTIKNGLAYMVDGSVYRVLGSGRRRVKIVVDK